MDKNRFLSAIPSVDQIEALILSGPCQHGLVVDACGPCLTAELERIFIRNIEGPEARHA